jgi:hypothetical protein
VALPVAALPRQNRQESSVSRTSQFILKLDFLETENVNNSKGPGLKIFHARGSRLCFSVLSEKLKMTQIEEP